jgi:hypothetical protein
MKRDPFFVSEHCYYEDEIKHLVNKRKKTNIFIFFLPFFITFHSPSFSHQKKSLAMSSSRPIGIEDPSKPFGRGILASNPTSEEYEKLLETRQEELPANAVRAGLKVGKAGILLRAKNYYPAKEMMAYDHPIFDFFHDKLSYPADENWFQFRWKKKVTMHASKEMFDISRQISTTLPFYAKEKKTDETVAFRVYSITLPNKTMDRFLVQMKRIQMPLKRV